MAEREGFELSTYDIVCISVFRCGVSKILIFQGFGAPFAVFSTILQRRVLRLEWSANGARKKPGEASRLTGLLRTAFYNRRFSTLLRVYSLKSNHSGSNPCSLHQALNMPVRYQFARSFTKYRSATVSISCS